jgi:hypothetical protein
VSAWNVQVETHGHLVQQVMNLLRVLGDEAADPGGVKRASFVEVVLRELCVVSGDRECMCVLRYQDIDSQHEHNVEGLGYSNAHVHS